MAEKVDAFSSMVTGAILSYKEYLKPQHEVMLYQKYGKQFGTMRQMLRLMGKERVVSGDEFFGFQDKHFHEVVICGQNLSDPGTGNPITFLVDTDNIDSKGNTYVRKGDHILTPGEVMCRVEAVTKTSPTVISVTMIPVNASKTIGALTDGMELAIVSASFGAGSSWPEPAMSAPEKSTFYLQEIKESIGTVGSRIADECYWQKDESGKATGNIWSEQYAQAEFRMDLKENGMLWFGELNTNNVATDDGQEAGEDIIMSQGFIPTIRSEGYTIPYPIGGWSYDYLFDIDKYLIQAGCTSNVVVFWVGNDLSREIQTSLFNSTKNTGVNFANIATGLFNMSANEDPSVVRGLELALSFSSIQIPGRTFVFHRIVEFDDPKTYGASGYTMSRMGIVMPVMSFQDAKNPNMTLNSAGLLYKGLGKHNRRYGVGTVSGGVFDGGIPILNYDETRTKFHAHIGLEIFKQNQYILMEQDT